MGHPFAAELVSERRAAEAAADNFARACESGDVEALFEAVDAINVSTDGWVIAMRVVARKVRAVSPEIKQAFLQVWVESNKLPLHVFEHRPLCNAARLLLPSYEGPAVRLFRGASAGERRRRIYGLSWTVDQAEAERFALECQAFDGGSVLLETLALSPAIISMVDYPEFRHEREYVVDRRRLSAVTVVRRYEQTRR